MWPSTAPTSTACWDPGMTQDPGREGVDPPLGGQGRGDMDGGELSGVDPGPPREPQEPGLTPGAEGGRWAPDLCACAASPWSS